ncbi:hypothetical protein SCG7086_BA_00120 [Chlamydiales bacterium SCGC AG-110-P3]|nr:hypothetical protein SCG7086_BA_00120 [Chlamydiales bacterium SCGC AG-110-P3]
MFSFRQKIFVTYLFVFLLVIVLIYPMTTAFVSRLTYKQMIDRADEFVAKIRPTPNDEAMIRRLKAEKALTFFRISIISDRRMVLYDSHAKRLLGPRFSQEFIVEHREVLDAFKSGIGFNIDYSDLLGKRFVYLAKEFDFHGKSYVIRVAIPYSYVEQQSADFQITILVIATVVLLFSSLLTWFVVQRLTKPIQQIVDTIRPYHEGDIEQLPRINIPGEGRQDDFFRLATTLNTLSDKAQSHIDSLKTERNEKAAVLDSLNEGVVAVDNNLQVIYSNRTALKMLDADAEEFIGHSIDIAGHEKTALQLRQSLEEKTTHNSLLELHRPGGRLYLNMATSPKGKNGGAILVLQDQSEHYRILNMRRQFIANASHELKTPITVIRGFAEALHDNSQLPQETVEEITNKIVRNCNRMTQLVKDLLALADIENLPASRLMHVDLIDLLDQCKTTLLGVFPDAIVKIIPEQDRPYHLVGDPSLLEMAFWNLMSNAAKYSEAPAKITVKLSHSEKAIELSFSDQGIGIPSDDLEHIFQRFYTVESHNSKKMGGSGLGLSIVDTIVEKHSGKISASSKVGEGTTFTIELPIKDHPTD